MKTMYDSTTKKMSMSTLSWVLERRKCTRVEGAEWGGRIGMGWEERRGRKGGENSEEEKEREEVLEEEGNEEGGGGGEEGEVGEEEWDTVNGD
jgi:hypothetical protein